MKVAIFTENSYCGGLDSFLITLFDHWPEAGDELVLLCNHGHPGLAVVEAGVHRPLSIVAHRLPMPADWLARVRWLPGGSVLARLASPLFRYLLFALQLRGVRRLLAAEAPDRLMIVNGGYPGGDSCRAATLAWKAIRGGRPAAIHNVHNLAYPPRWWNRPLENVIDRRVGRATAAFVAVSRACAASIPEQRPAVGHTPVLHVYNGIPAPAEAVGAADAFRRELGIGSDVPLAVMLGTYEPRKGHAFLLAAWQRVVAVLPTARLAICGFGYPEEVAAVETLVRGHGVGESVRLFGFRRDAGAVIAAADLLVVPSQSFESFGLTVVEAMAREVPVVATRVGGMPEVLGAEEGGFLVAPDDVAGLAGRMLAVLRDPALANALGRQGRQRYLRHFTALAMVGQYAALIRGGPAAVARGTAAQPGGAAGPSGAPTAPGPGRP